MILELGRAFASARRAAEGLAEADRDALEAIEAIEKRLLGALDGATLHGLPDLGDRVCGIRVQAEGFSTSPLAPDGRAVPVLDHRGVLVVASMHGRCAFVQRAPRGMIRAGLLVPYIRAVQSAIALHLEFAQGPHSELSALARTIAEAA